jgi:hypothetical protein
MDYWHQALRLVVDLEAMDMDEDAVDQRQVATYKSES